ncbi:MULTISPECIES: ABC transporter substrate-binding protein [unclassified Mesorhizobium]|uniref:ABC transporter substrate-binding protein n=1 Tax=unclassified Mesorhizobium TaxID=325217 RepID=UPI001FCDD567|nr:MULTISPECIES: ABC transporter substrate-binding protein [unclassified Mesorhizobium]
MTGVAALAMSAVSYGSVFAQANPAEVKVALIAPMSGPWARQGELMKKGAELAIKDINAAGGVEKLGGAKMKLMIFDAGDTTEKAKNAAQRMVSQEPDLVGVSGAWLSSFTLSVSEVTERAELPMVTLSYSDQITSRGFKYIFQMPPTGVKQAEDALPALMEVAQKATGKKPTKTGIVSDNTASSVSFAKPMREGGLKAMGIDLLFDETFTPPLADATALIQQARSKRPEFLIMLGTSVPDDKLMLEKVNEFNLGGGRMPIISSGAHIGAPELLKNIGPDLLEGVMSVVGNWGAKGQEEIIQRFKTETGEPWMTQDSISAYGDMWLFKQALEDAGKADKKAVGEALRKMDTTEGPAKYYPGGHIKFDEAGHNVNAKLIIVQWQGGEPKPIYPPESALAEPVWPTN